MAESLSYQARAEYPPEHAFPLLFKAIEANVRQMISLSHPHILAVLSLTPADVVKDRWWLARVREEESISQAIGREPTRAELRLLARPQPSHRIWGLILSSFLITFPAPI